MYSIYKNKTEEYIINKSKFITKIYYINKYEEISLILDTIKKDYKDATHHCYAYIVDELEKASDDKEPSGTAGIPILNVLKKNNLNHILCVVIRYFGGIKLGAGGLVRAYSNCTSETLKDSIAKYIESYTVRVEFNYQDINKINLLLKDSKILYKEFNDTVIYELIIAKNIYEKIKNELKNSSIIDNNYILENKT